MKKRELHNFVSAIKKLRESASDETALETAIVYAEWREDGDYKKDDRIRYGDTLYRCVQPHVANPSWRPDLVPALWAKISIEEYPEWEQPYGASDAYNVGDKVSHNGKHWISTSDANVWEPGVYGWSECA